MYKDEGFDILRVKSKVISGKQRSTNDMTSMRCSLNSNLPDGVGIHYRDGNGARGLGAKGAEGADAEKQLRPKKEGTVYVFLSRAYPLLAL